MLYSLRQWVCVGMCVFFVHGCRKSRSSTDLSVPVLDALPSATNQAQLKVTGKKTQGSSVFIQYQQESEGRLWVDATPAENFEATLQLHEGVNRFVLSAKEGNRRSSVSQTYTIQLDTQPPEMPLLVNFEDVVYLPNNIPRRITLSFRKEKNTTLWKNGEKIPGCLDVLCLLSDITVQPGENRIRWFVKDGAGNTSPVLEWVVYGVSQTGASIDVNPMCQSLACQAIAVSDDTFASANAPNPYLVKGTLAFYDDPSLVEQEWDVYFLPLRSMTEVIPLNSNPSAAVLIQPNAEGQWEHLLELGEGSHFFAVYAKSKGSSESVRGPAIRRSFIKDTLPPQPPVLNVSFAGVVTGSNTTVSVKPPSDGYVCYKKNTESISAQVCYETLFGAQVNPSVSLDYGENMWCFYAVDLVGNQSGQRCVSLYRLSEPDVRIEFPLHGSYVVKNGTTDISVYVAPSVKDIQASRDSRLVQEQSSIALRGVSVELDGLPCGRIVQEENMYVAQECLKDADTSVASHMVLVRAQNEAHLEKTVFSQFVFFSKETRIISTTGVAKNSSQPSVASDALGYTHVVWKDDCVNDSGCRFSEANNTAPDIFYRRFSSQGMDPIMLISSGGSSKGASENPVVSVDAQNNVHVAWIENKRGIYRVLYRKITYASGSDERSLGDIKVVFENSNNSYVSLHMDTDTANNAHLVWISIQGLSRQLYYRKITEGIPLEIDGPLGSDETVFVANPFVLASGAVEGRVYVAWNTVNSNNKANPSDIYVGIFSGRDWEIKNVNNDVLDGEGDSFAPSLLELPSGELWVMWSDNGLAGEDNRQGADYDIMLRTFDPTPTSLAPTTTVAVLSRGMSDSFQNAYDVSASYGAGKTVVVWSRVESTSPLRKTIQYVYDTPENILNSIRMRQNRIGVAVDAGMETAETPSVTVDSSRNAVVVWQDLFYDPSSLDEPMLDTDVFYSIIPSSGVLNDG